MEQAVIEMVKNAPWAAAFVIVVRLFLDAQKQTESTRVANAEVAGAKQRDHEVQLASINHSHHLEINNLWASTVKNIIKDVTEGNDKVADAVERMHRDLSEQYKNFGITQDLLNIARDELRHK